jgi:hypothetical protein
MIASIFFIIVLVLLAVLILIESQVAVGRRQVKARVEVRHKK